MSKILVTTDDGTVAVEIYELPDLTALTTDHPSEAPEPTWGARCSLAGCWDSFVDDRTEHRYQADAISDAQAHLASDHQKVS
jgi:hypothetical protein